MLVICFDVLWVDWLPLASYIIFSDKGNFGYLILNVHDEFSQLIIYDIWFRTGFSPSLGVTYLIRFGCYWWALMCWNAFIVSFRDMDLETVKKTPLGWYLLSQSSVGGWPSGYTYAEYWVPVVCRGDGFPHRFGLDQPWMVRQSWFYDMIHSLIGSHW